MTAKENKIMPRISVDYYELKDGDLIDNPLVAAIASVALSAGYKDPTIAFISVLYGDKEQKHIMVSDVARKMSSIQKDHDAYIATAATISPFEFPPNKYTIEKQGEDDTREIIPVDEVIGHDIAELKEFGFEPIFDEPGSVNTFCIYTGADHNYDPGHAKAALKFIRELPEENPEPTHMRVTQEELAKMMGGEMNEEADESSKEE